MLGIDTTPAMNAERCRRVNPKITISNELAIFGDLVYSAETGEWVSGGREGA